MPRILNKIKDPQNEFTLLNTNFDRISLDIADRSGSYSSTGTLSGQTIPTGTSLTLSVSVNDVYSTFVLNKLPVIPRVDLYLDHDLDANYYYPTGNSLSNANIHGFQISVVQGRTVLSPGTNQKGIYYIYMHNGDSVDHTVYVYTDAFYVPAPERGIAVRPT